MAIDISTIVRVIPRVINVSSDIFRLNLLLLSVSNYISKEDRVLAFYSASSVGEYFGNTSQEYASAVTYFSGYKNAYSLPTVLYFGLRVPTDIPAWLEGGSVSALATLKAINDGSMSITIGGVTKEVVGLDFTLETSFSGIATIIQTAIRALDVTPEWANSEVNYDSIKNSFRLTVGISGVLSTIGYAGVATGGTDISGLLFWTQATGGLLSQGGDVETPDQTMEACRAVTKNWTSYTWLDDLGADDQMLYVSWSSLYSVNYLPIPYSLSKVDIDALQTAILVGSYNSSLVYGGIQLAVFTASMVASLDYERTDGYITLAFKSQVNIAVTVDNTSEAVDFSNRAINFYGNYDLSGGTRFYQTGAMTGGEYGWVDAYVNTIWLNRGLQTAYANLLANSPGLPYNEAGYSQVLSASQVVLTKGSNFGMFATGGILDDQALAQANQEAGADISTQLQTQGYYIQVKDPSTAVINSRGSPIISLWYVSGQVIQKIEVFSTAIA